MDQGETSSPSAALAPTDAQRAHELKDILTRCKRMTSVGDLISLLDLITTEATKLLRADRATIFLLDRDKCELWSVIAHANEKRLIRFDARLGIAGAVAMTGEMINVADAYEHPLFFKEVDCITGYRTRELLAVPLRNRQGQIVGVGEVINKQQGLFSGEDAELLQMLAAHVADTFGTTQLDKVSLGSLERQKESQKEIGGEFSTRNIIGMSHPVQSIVRLIDQIRDSAVDVLIQGESGTGKELVAQALHYNSSRAHHPFVALNCAAIPDNLVESELFGIEKGVATGVDRRMGKFEEAHEGTLFLDEIGDLSLPAQAKILRVLQERSATRVGGRTPIPFDIRLISATNRDLAAAMRQGTFRADLYHRLKVVHIETPALREVPEDIPILANHFLAKYCKAANTDLKEFTPAALECLASYTWPGNARQLENEVKRLIASVRGRSITQEHLDISIRSLPQSPEPQAQPLPSPKSLPDAVEALERRMIQEALRQTAGNKQKAAQTLGVSRQGLIKKLKRYGMAR
jgi:Nif-specific regulatory protein